MERSFSGKTVLVTGASRGLGRALAHAFADAGANVAFSYISSAAAATSLVQELEAKGVQAAAFQADQGDPVQAGNLVKAAVARFGGLDILINNAAIAVQGRTIDDPAIDNAVLDRQWAINVGGVVAGIRAAVQHMGQGGRIVSIGSGVASRAGFAGTADYAGSKAAIVGYSKGAARDLGARGITVNVVQAGVMDTDMSKDAAPFLPTLLGTLAIGRLARFEEITAAVLFLASPQASYITGAVLDVEGGYGA